MFLTNAWSAGYIPPAQGARYQVAFGGASLANGLTNTLTFTNGLFKVDPGQTNNLGLTNSLATGVLDGSFTFPSARNAHLFYGAFVSPALGGSGYFLDTNSQTGWFVITGIDP